MKTYLNGGHYFVHIGELDEFPNLKRSPLEATLQNGEDGSDFHKKVTLTYDHKAKEDSIEFIPPEAYFEEIKEINITINREQYDNLEQNRMSIFRFGGSFSVDLYLESDLERLI